MSGARDLQPGSPALPLVLFSAGPWRFGIEARWVASSRPGPEGIAGEAVEVLAGLPTPAPASGPRQVLVLRQGGLRRQVVVGQPVDLAEIPVSLLHALPPLIASRIGLRGAKALALTDDGQCILIFDPAAW